jgi:hypothetical protein
MPSVFQTARMGRIFLEHIGGVRLFSCAHCDTVLTNRSELISTRYYARLPRIPRAHWRYAPILLRALRYCPHQQIRAHLHQVLRLSASYSWSTLIAFTFSPARTAILSSQTDHSPFQLGITSVCPYVQKQGFYVFWEVLVSVVDPEGYQFHPSTSICDFLPENCNMLPKVSQKNHSTAVFAYFNGSYEQHLCFYFINRLGCHASFLILC